LSRKYAFCWSEDVLIRCRNDMSEVRGRSDRGEGRGEREEERCVGECGVVIPWAVVYGTYANR
jgi:hypothetical protein